MRMEMRAATRSPNGRRLSFPRPRREVEGRGRPTRKISTHGTDLSAATRNLATEGLAFRVNAKKDLLPSGELPSLIEHCERARSARHHEAVAVLDQPLDIFSVRMLMAADDVVLLADLEDAVDRVGDDRMIVVPGWPAPGSSRLRR